MVVTICFLKQSEFSYISIGLCIKQRVGYYCVFCDENVMIDGLWSHI